MSDSPRPGNFGHALFVHALLAGALYLVWLVLSPALHALIFAAVLAFLAEPLRRRVEAKIPGRENVAALAVSLAVAALVILPVLGLLAALVVDGVAATARLQERVSQGGLAAALGGERLAEAIAWAKANLPFGDRIDFEAQAAALSGKAGAFLIDQGSALAANAAELLTGVFILFFVLFYFVRDGRTLLARAGEYSPLTSRQGRDIAGRLGRMAKSVFVGTFLTALAQGVAGGVGLAFVGISPLFWGAVMALASLVPLVGTALVWAPAAAWLAFGGNPWGALFLAVWCVAVVGTVDNFLRPFLMSGEDGLSPLWIFLGVVGGLRVFGLPGILYGPLILTFAAAVLDLYKGEFLGPDSGSA